MPAATPDRPWLPWYDKARWKRRARLQLQMHPLCKICFERGVIEAAEVADHVIPHRGDEQLFWFGELNSCCRAHHDGTKQELERKGYCTDIGNDGFPIDPNAPFNKLKQG